MGNIKIIKGVFDTKLELEHAGIAAGFPSPADEYRHETLDFNRDYIRHPEASFYGDVVKAEAEVTKVDGKKIEFKVSAYSGDVLLGEGKHLRFIVDRGKFMSKFQ